MHHRPPGPQPTPRRRTGSRFAAARRSAAILALLVAASASYTVRPGDTLSGIAQRHGVSVSALAQANGITDANRITAGQTLTIPSGSSGGAAGNSPGSSAGSSAGATTHRVARGETLSHIAARYGVRVADLAAANGLANRNRITAGQSLSVPGRGSGGSTAAPAPAPATSARPPGGAASRAEVGAMIERTARQHGWNPALVKAVAWQESGWNQNAVSSAGARGVMQIMPGTMQFINQSLAPRRLDINNTADNILAGVLYLDHLHGLTGGDRDRTLAGYYQGLASVRRNGMYPSTHAYIRNVNSLVARF